MMAGRMGAVAAVKAGAKRRRAAESRRKNEERVDTLFDHYDTDKSGFLSRQQLTNLLTDLNGGVPPSAEEIQWVFYNADKSDGNIDSKIEKHEVKPALDAFKNYKEHEGEVNTIFRRYDTNGSGKLEEDQLKKVLTHLNDDIEPSDEEVAWVLKMADEADGVVNGGVNKTELQIAISLWFSHHDKAGTDCCTIC